MYIRSRGYPRPCSHRQIPPKRRHFPEPRAELASNAEHRAQSAPPELFDFRRRESEDDEKVGVLAWLFRCVATPRSSRARCRRRMSRICRTLLQYSGYILVRVVETLVCRDRVDRKDRGGRQTLCPYSPFPSSTRTRGTCPCHLGTLPPPTPSKRASCAQRVCLADCRDPCRGRRTDRAPEGLTRSAEERNGGEGYKLRHQGARVGQVEEWGAAGVRQAGGMSGRRSHH
ncbi:hypothetical protein DFH08DRAFT_388161 [Mycena albidolilacea]|uniref:Uncharacterized protein n=1 Tax=Mycena albidolilacea TaxID=1033008 RepID=A0AAD6ZFM1_9AGAR|nr:hypothetical protein DFH08DRAFT_388161 [Mycena albidolilacea]